MLYLTALLPAGGAFTQSMRPPSRPLINAKGLAIFRIIQLLADIYDRFDTHASKKRLEKVTVTVAAFGFLVHLTLIAVVQLVPGLKNGWLSGLDRNFLHAVYTPFSFILFYEVLLLVLAIPTSHTSSIGKQYEIISLIVIRRVFKDIGEFRDPTALLKQMDAATAVLLDMAAAVLMFLLVTTFYRLRQTVIRRGAGDELQRFVSIKKAVAVPLCGVLVGLALFNLVQWLISVIVPGTVEPATEMDLDLFFFPAFFEFMIFADVLLLILSLPFYERYEFVIRNAGFVISTVLLRFSLTTPKPFDLLVSLIAMIYGLCVLAVFSYYSRVSASASGPNPRSRNLEEDGKLQPSLDPEASERPGPHKSSSKSSTLKPESERSDS